MGGRALVDPRHKRLPLVVELAELGGGEEAVGGDHRRGAHLEPAQLDAAACRDHLHTGVIPRRPSCTRASSGCRRRCCCCGSLGTVRGYCIRPMSGTRTAAGRSTPRRNTSVPAAPTGDAATGAAAAVGEGGAAD
eukprot:scaffold64306_cov60-Phaeocystis_antarctica.AAC.1